MRLALGGVLGVALLALGSPAAVAQEAEPTPAETCVTPNVRFIHHGGAPRSVTVPITPVAGTVASITVVVDDPPHPQGATQTSERVTISLGSHVVGTTPDLPDDETGATHVLPVGVALEFDTVTITHAPDEGPDSITVVSI